MKKNERLNSLQNAFQTLENTLQLLQNPPQYEMHQTSTLEGTTAPCDIEATKCKSASLDKQINENHEKISEALNNMRIFVRTRRETKVETRKSEEVPTGILQQK